MLIAGALLQIQGFEVRRVDDKSKKNYHFDHDASSADMLCV